MPEGALPSWPIADLLLLTRRVVLRAVIDRFLGGAILEAGGEAFLASFMRFQDRVEAATAVAAVLPRWLALPVALWPVAFLRRRLTAFVADLISPALAGARGAGPRGPWLVAFAEEGLAPDAAAELVLGLLFAAHKNPAIGAFQAYCFLHGWGTDGDRDRVRREGQVLAQRPTLAVLRRCEHTCRCALEALRLSAHAIGAIRTAMDDFDLRGPEGRTWRVRRGETVALSHIAWSIDEASWGDAPTAYRAARPEYRSPVCFDRRGDCDAVKFSVFSQGAHRCPGETLALVIVETVLALYHSRNVQVDQKAWELHSEAIPPVCFARATLAQRAGPVKCKLLAPRARC